MIQIVIWMLCVYMVLKGVELRTIAAASPDATRSRNIERAKLWQIIACVAAAIFFILSIVQGNEMPTPPSSFGTPY